MCVKIIKLHYSLLDANDVCGFSMSSRCKRCNFICIFNIYFDTHMWVDVRRQSFNCRTHLGALNKNKTTFKFIIQICYATNVNFHLSVGQQLKRFERELNRKYGLCMHETLFKVNKQIRNNFFAAKKTCLHF